MLHALAPRKYLEELLAAAGPDAIDYISVHAYGLMGPKASRPTNKSGVWVHAVCTSVGGLSRLWGFLQLRSFKGNLSRTVALHNILCYVLSNSA